MIIVLVITGVAFFLLGMALAGAGRRCRRERRNIATAITTIR